MKKIAAIFITVLMGTPFWAVAQSGSILPPCGGAGQDACKICNLFELIDNIIKFVIIDLIPVIAGLVIAVAGFKMLINQNNAEVMAESKKIILMVIIGLLLIYGSFAIVTAVMDGMGYIDGNPLEFNSLDCN